MSDTPTSPKTATAVRSSFLEFFQKRAGHEIVQSASVIPHDDPTLLFTNAGMNQFKDVFLGTGTRPYCRAVDTQKCIRAGGKHNDLEDVGRDTWHHTFFEMLGNWSLGDYFKREAITWAWELLTEVWQLPKERLHITVFAGDADDQLEADEETEKLWLELTDIDPSHVTRWGRKDNFWEMGATGPCGPCSEIHFDSTPDLSGAALVNHDHPDVIEIWNLVFIQFNRREDGSLAELPAQHVDTGMGFERVLRVLQGKRSNYDTDLWAPLFEAIARETGASPYRGAMDSPVDEAHRVVADHIRCLTIAIADGGRPGAEGRGYVLRRILRRAARMARQSLGGEGAVLSRLVPVVVESLGATFPELHKQADTVIEIIRSEEEGFLRTLDRGLVRFAEVADACEGVIPGDQAFLLHDTFGFPIDLTEQMARERELTVDRVGYEAAMQDARERSRRGDSATDTVRTIPPEVLGGLEQLGVQGTDDSAKYTRPMGIGHVRAIWNGDNLVESVSPNERVAVILDRTTFYGEQGGQVGDTGRLITEAEGSTPGQCIFKVESTTRAGPYVLHIGQLIEGSMQCGDAVDTRIDEPKRHAIERHHTATHLLNYGLRTHLGEQSDQRGSLVADDRLRFDYAASSATELADIQAIEMAVREAIDADLVVDGQEVSLDQATAVNGVRAIFGERYPDPVRVVSIGASVQELISDPANERWSAQSTEFCGGTHVKSTGRISDFVIIQEQGLAAGIRRVTALAGDPARRTLQAGLEMLARLRELKDLEDDSLPAALDETHRDLQNVELGLIHRREAEVAIAQLRKKAKEMRKAISGASKAIVISEAQQLAEVATGEFVIGEVAATDRDTLLAAMDAVRGAKPDAACLLACRPSDTGKVIIAARVPDALIKRGLKAGDWVRQAAQACGGGGGGRPDSAQAGGKDPTKMPESLEAASVHATETLS
ncbi:MAG: alanine--tRNA ligase [Phycisphaerales bacterium]|nr:alanine--tRNA ligase [Phycisphaerales bacterium]